MKVLFLSSLDPRENPSLWSGTALSILRGLEYLGHSVHVQPIGLTPAYWYEAVKWRFYRWVLKRNYAIEQDPVDLWFNRQRMKRKLRGVKFDMVMSWIPWHLSLVETDKPKAFWYDTTFIKTQPLYFADLCGSSFRHWLALDAKIARESAAAIYPSEWARQSAILDYGAWPERVHTIAFGANFAGPTAAEVAGGIERRVSRCRSFVGRSTLNVGRSKFELERTSDVEHPTSNAKLNHPDPKPKTLPEYGSTALAEVPERGPVRLLFVGVDWERKSGQTAVDVTKELNRRGMPTKLFIVGCRPELADEDLKVVEIIGRLNKSDPAELKKLQALYLESDFFIMTSRAESYGIVYCEAMASGLPSLATVTGGVGQIVRNDVTGCIVEWGPNTVGELANFVLKKWRDPEAYRSLAEKTFQTFQEEFNWEASYRRLGKVIDQIRGEA